MRAAIRSIFFSELVLVLVVTLVRCGGSEEVVDIISLEPTRKPSSNEDIIKTKVSVYVESLCPDCHEFIHQQLAPAFRKYADYIDLDMVPFGNAKIINHPNGSVEVDCQHGAQECVGNLYEACATNQLQDKDPKTLMEYFDCLAVKPDKQDFKKSAMKCAKDHHISFDTLSSCADSEGQGQGLILEYGKRTQALTGRQGVPAVAFDDKFQPDEQDEIIDNFVKALCDTLRGGKPSDCNTVE